MDASGPVPPVPPQETGAPIPKWGFFRVFSPQHPRRSIAAFFGLCTPLLFATAHSASSDYFAIRVTDAATGRGVPLISLTTTNHIRHITDSAGWIAFNEPGLMDREVFFKVEGPGYTYPKDGFGFAGARLHPRAGESAVIKVTRENIAERLYRVTGQGIYRDSVLLGKDVPLPEPALFAGEVLGQDSVNAVPYRGRLFWLWGDTNLPNYPLGNFHTTCAWSDLPGQGGLDPARGVALQYLTGADGRVRKMAPTDQPGVLWISGLLTIRDEAGAEHLLGQYGRFKSMSERLEHGLTEFDDKSGIFVMHPADETVEWRHPDNNAFRVTGSSGDYFYFCESFPVVRVRADYASVRDPKAYEAFAWSDTAGGYVWQKEKPPATQSGEAAAIKAGNARFQVVDAATGEPVVVHRSSVNWNEYRRRWVMIAIQHMSKVSVLGEVWYAEADDPSGPWTKAVKIVSHPRYSFYNPRHHVFFDQEGGRFIHFEGTYTESFSGNPVPTPRYDYNQIMYRLDLADERLKAVH